MRSIGELLAVVASESSEHPFVGSPEQKAAWDEIKSRVEVAHGGLLRALDFRTATPEGLTIKGDVRDALILSGFTGPWGEAGSPTDDLLRFRWTREQVGLIIDGVAALVGPENRGGPESQILHELQEAYRPGG